MYTVRDALTLRAQASATKVAVVDGTRRLTYAQLDARSRCCAALLERAGVRRGDRVAIFLRRSTEAVTALFGAWYAGGIAVILHEALRAAQVHHILQHSDAACLVTDRAQRRAAPERRPGDVRVIQIDEVADAEAAPPAAPIIGADLALLIYTSGSTGLPKGVMVSHDNLLSGTHIVSEYLQLSERDVIVSLLPFSFDYGLNQLLTALWAGGTFVIQRSLFPPDICATLARERVTGLAGVPTLWLQLTGRQSPFPKMAFPNLRYVTNTGGRLPEHVVRAIRAAHPDVQIYLMYGLTEAFRATYLPPSEVDRRPSSIGKAIPNVEVFVLREDGTPCAPGEVGELVQRGATVAMGYWRDPEATARVFRPHPLEPFRSAGERVVFSGDLVRTDAEGFLYYVGRRDQLIKSRGIRVSPEEIERCIASSGLVANVVSFAVPRDDVDSDIVAAVVPHDPPSFSVAALEDFCKREMPEYMVPQMIWRLDGFPLTTSGKPDRGTIREMYVDRRERSGSVA